MTPSSDIDFVVAIPARFAATRLPGKPLRELGGMPLVLHVAHRALAAGAREVWVAADDLRIVEALRDCAVHVAMTSSHHASGSDRLAECAAIAGWDDDTIIVNLQGDEPFAPATGIRAVATLLRDTGAAISTLAAAIEDAAQLFDPNVVKLVRADNGDALYFSRAPIPWQRDEFARDRTVLPANGLWFRHIGIYGYRTGTLKQFAAMPRGRLEQTESLEQLRALEAGLRIAVGITPEPFPAGVDTEEDLERAERHLSSLQV